MLTLDRLLTNLAVSRPRLLLQLHLFAALLPGPAYHRMLREPREAPRSHLRKVPGQALQRRVAVRQERAPKRLPNSGRGHQQRSNPAELLRPDVQLALPKVNADSASNTRDASTLLCNESFAKRFLPLLEPDIYARTSPTIMILRARRHGFACNL